MSYIATGVFTKDHKDALEVSPDELRALSPEARADYTLRVAEVKAAKTSAFWDALASAIPIITFLGLQRYFK